MQSLIRRDSLSLAFFGIFVICFVLHLLSACSAINENSKLLHIAAMSIPSCSGSSHFWFLTFQTWEAEYMAIAAYITLTIFLRQQGSPESKPTDSSNEETGKANK
jgi:hypothetical protein